MTEAASKNLKDFNSPSVCENWKEAFMESLIGKNFKTSEEKRTATTKAESMLKEISSMWKKHFPEDAKGAAHYEIFLLIGLKKDTNESYKKFYERRYREHIDGLKKVLAQFGNESAFDEDRAEFSERIRMAEFLKSYATSANKPVDAKKAAWALILNEMQLAHPEMDQKLLASIVVGASSFNQSPDKLCPHVEIRKAIPVEDDHVEGKTKKKQTN